MVAAKISSSPGLPVFSSPRLLVLNPAPRPPHCHPLSATRASRQNRDKPGKTTAATHPSDAIKLQPKSDLQPMEHGPVRTRALAVGAKALNSLTVGAPAIAAQRDHGRNPQRLCVSDRPARQALRCEVVAEEGRNRGMAHGVGAGARVGRKELRRAHSRALCVATANGCRED